MSFSVIKNPCDNIDFQAGQSILYGREVVWAGNRHDDWSLIFCIDGSGEIYSEDGSLKVQKKSLVMIAPGHPHRFKTSNWNILWFHFLMRSHMPKEVFWTEPVSGIFYLDLVTREYRRAYLALNEVLQLDLQRGHGWYHLAYGLLETVILRGNVRVNPSIDSHKSQISHAQKLLSDLGKGWSIDEVALKCGMSRVAFFNKFKSIVGTSPQKYRELCAMRRAQHLLEDSDLSISEIANLTGMPNIYYFSNRFKKFSGFSPSVYRGRNR